MIELRHIGIYVMNLTKMEQFYKNAFSMKIIQSQILTSNPLIDAIIGKEKEVLISKLITPYGCQTGTGDMIELIQIVNANPPKPSFIYSTGTAHIGFGVDSIEETIESITAHGGKIRSEIFRLGQNKCCFCTDPEGNWLELICHNNS